VKIPIANYYFLLVYTWGLVRESEAITKQVGSYSTEFPLDMLVELLVVGLKDQLRKGLDRGYVEFEEITSHIRGKINISQSIKQNTFVSSKLHCEYTDLSHDVLQNQLLKAVLNRTVRSNSICKALKQDVRELTSTLNDVSDIKINRRDFHDILIHKNNRQYRLLLNIAQLIFECLLPDQKGDQFLFVEFPEDRKADIFEGFVRNYLAKNLSGYTVKERRFNWADTSASEADLGMLPQLRADVVIDSESTRNVIEVKFYEDSIKAGYKSDRKKIISAHLNQLFVYLSNLSICEVRKLSGVLLYAMSDERFDLKYTIHGFKIRVLTIDLSQTPDEIGIRLVDIARS
jgi:5-methylcytosine-specific restriction enzyme subunit McrC